MINSSKVFEGLLQQSRFKMAIPFLKGDVLDFGGNEGREAELILTRIVSILIFSVCNLGVIFDIICMTLLTSYNRRFPKLSVII